MNYTKKWRIIYKIAKLFIYSSANKVSIKLKLIMMLPPFIKKEAIFTGKYLSIKINV